MRGALIGFGSIAAGHLFGYQQVEGLDVVAALDLSAERRRLAKERYGLAAYSSFDELISNEQLDFVDICTPPYAHTEYSLAGLQHGLHVLCEKPVLMPDENGGYELLLKEIAASEAVFYPCHVYKFAPILGQLRHITTADTFGAVLGASFRTHRRGHAVGVTDWRPDWRRESEFSGGGILRDHGPHSIYLAMNLTNRRPLAVSCLTGRFCDDEYRDTEDTALLRVRCDGDTEVALTLTWASGDRNTGYSVRGERGSVVVEGDELHLTLEGQTVSSCLDSGFDDPSHKHWFSEMLRDFLHVVCEPHRQTTLLQEAIITAQVIDAAYASAGEWGKWVDVEAASDRLMSIVTGDN
ncbi:MAG: Gfo/Idh/MocA family oxidoreductase [Nocardioides sp.]|nr:Gfo/Idh/MocA family oxidoreductase [Nocardioides sp.]